MVVLKKWDVVMIATVGKLDLVIQSLTWIVLLGVPMLEVLEKQKVVMIPIVGKLDVAIRGLKWLGWLETGLEVLKNVVLSWLVGRRYMGERYMGERW